MTTGVLEEFRIGPAAARVKPRLRTGPAKTGTLNFSLTVDSSNGS